jgi:hypothetical protein
MYETNIMEKEAKRLEMAKDTDLFAIQAPGCLDLVKYLDAGFDVTGCNSDTLNSMMYEDLLVSCTIGDDMKEVEE